MSDNKISFKTRYIYGKPHIYANCPKSEALFQLLRRGEIETYELPLIGKLGFDIEIIGDTGELSSEMDRKELAYQKITPGRIKVDNRRSYVEAVNSYRDRGDKN